MLTKVISYDHSITELAHIQIRQITRIMEDGKEISKISSSFEEINPFKDSVAGKDARAVLLMNKFKGARTSIKPLAIMGQGLEKVVTYDNSLTKWGHVQVRQITKIFEEGIEISKTYHRHIISPGDNVINEDILSKLTAEAIHTSKIIAVYEAMLVEQRQ